MLAVPVLLSACSMGQVVVRGTQSILDGGIDAMNREADLSLARDAMPANLKLLEGMLVEDPKNVELRVYAAQGFYGYAYGFIEAEDRERARKLYRRCYEHGRAALRQAGLALDPESARPSDLEAAARETSETAVPSLFWTASCLAKWTDLSRDKPGGIAELSSAAALMERVLELDDDFYYGGAHLFFGVYYGGRSPLFGGRHELAEQHFKRAAEINHGKLLLTDLLYAEYFARQKLDRAAFHARLTHILDAPDNLFPEMALVNAIARRKAQHLLQLEDDWF